MGSGFSNELGKESLREDVMRQLDGALQGVRSDDPSLTELFIPSCGLGVKGAQIGAAALATNTHLIALNIDYNQLGPEGCAAILEGLKSNTTLRVLHMAGNAIGEAGCKEVAAFLKSDPPLTELSLYHNELDDACVLHLANALQYNTHLTHLSLAMNHLTNSSAIMLLQCFRHNNTLAVLNLSANGPFDEKVMLQMQEKTSANMEALQRRLQHEAIKAKKEALRKAQEEESAKAKESEMAKQAQEVGDAVREVEVANEKDAEQIAAMESKEQISQAEKKAMQQQLRERRMMETQKAMQAAFEWRNKLTSNGTLVKEWRNGFTIMTTRPGDPPGAPPSVTRDPPRRLQACWCEPKDATSPFARKLHYHCKYEKLYDDLKGDEGAPPKYEGCKGSGHICASVGFYAKPLKNDTAANFFGSPHPPTNVLTQED